LILITLLQQLGRWNGLVKSILDGDADIAISALQITPDRADVIDFSVPFLETGISILETGISILETGVSTHETGISILQIGISIVKTGISILHVSIIETGISILETGVFILETGISILVAVRDGVISPMAFLGIILQQFYLLFFSLFLFLLLSCLLQWAAADIMLSAACVSLCVRIRIPIFHPTKSANRRSEPNVP